MDPCNFNGAMYCQWGDSPKSINSIAMTGLGLGLGLGGSYEKSVRTGSENMYFQWRNVLSMGGFPKVYK